MSLLLILDRHLGMSNGFSTPSLSPATWSELYTQRYTKSQPAMEATGHPVAQHPDPADRATLYEGLPYPGLLGSVLIGNFSS